MKILLRQETPEDQPAVKNVLDAAFGQSDESLMVERLRQSPEYIPELSLIAERNGVVVGCIHFSRLIIRSGAADHFSLSLAPVAVLPEFQNRGIGTLLIREGLERARELGFSSVVVIGHPAYYPRFGFKPAGRWDITALFPVPGEAFMAMELVKGGLDGVSGTVIFSQAFGLGDG